MHFWHKLTFGNGSTNLQFLLSQLAPSKDKPWMYTPSYKHIWKIQYIKEIIQKARPFMDNYVKSPGREKPEHLSDEMKWRVTWVKGPMNDLFLPPFQHYPIFFNDKYTVYWYLRQVVSWCLLWRTWWRHCTKSQNQETTLCVLWWLLVS